MAHSTQYTLVFAGAVCFVCAIVVSGAAVGLGPRQEANERLDRQRKVLEADGALAADEIGAAEAQRRFDAIEAVVVDLQTDRERPDLDPTDLPAEQMSAPENAAGLKSMPRYVVVYKHHTPDGGLDRVIVPVVGQGMWSRLEGYLALDGDLVTVRTLTFHTQKETPGLGAEIDTPAWKALWKDRRAYGPDGAVAIEVIKGAAGPAAEDPFHVDGITGATITSRAVSELVRFWLGKDGLGPYLTALRQETE